MFLTKYEFVDKDYVIVQTGKTYKNKQTINETLSNINKLSFNNDNNLNVRSVIAVFT